MVGGGLLDYNVSYLGQVIVIVIGRPRSLTIIDFIFQSDRISIANIVHLHWGLFSNV